jgi:hypothetical protein
MNPVPSTSWSLSPTGLFQFECVWCGICQQRQFEREESIPHWWNSQHYSEKKGVLDYSSWNISLVEHPCSGFFSGPTVGIFPGEPAVTRKGWSQTTATAPQTKSLQWIPPRGVPLAPPGSGPAGLRYLQQGVVCWQTYACHAPSITPLIDCCPEKLSNDHLVFNKEHAEGQSVLNMVN